MLGGEAESGWTPWSALTPSPPAPRREVRDQRRQPLGRTPWPRRGTCGCQRTHSSPSLTCRSCRRGQEDWHSGELKVFVCVSCSLEGVRVHDVTLRRPWENGTPEYQHLEAMVSFHGHDGSGVSGFPGHSEESWRRMCLTAPRAVSRGAIAHTCARCSSFSWRQACSARGHGLPARTNVRFVPRLDLCQMGGLFNIPGVKPVVVRDHPT